MSFSDQAKRLTASEVATILHDRDKLRYRLRQVDEEWIFDGSARQATRYRKLANDLEASDKVQKELKL